jgi:hypothetical protein
VIEPDRRLDPGSYRVLDEARPTDRAEWLRLWRAWPEQEPTAHPAFVALFARPGDRAVCLVTGGEASGVLFPLVLRPLGVEPWAAPGETRWDAVSPYGYGGPFAWGGGPRDGFWDAAEHWLRGAGVVTAFARLSLFPDELLPFRGEVVDNAPAVVRRLDLDGEAIWQDYAHKVRKNVNAARRAGLSFEIDVEGRRLDDFLAIYESTMDRRQAGDGYYFSREFFETILREMPGSCLLAHVLDAGRVVSTELVLRSATRLYSFLGGTLADAFEKRPNDLLKHEVGAWGRGAGLRAYVLGGGYAGTDGIFRYKLAFAPSGEVPFRVGCWVLDSGATSALIETRRASELAGGNDWSPRPGFFPAYRA